MRQQHLRRRGALLGRRHLRLARRTRRPAPPGGMPFKEPDPRAPAASAKTRRPAPPRRRRRRDRRQRRKGRAETAGRGGHVAGADRDRVRGKQRSRERRRRCRDPRRRVAEQEEELCEGAAPLSIVPSVGPRTGTTRSAERLTRSADRHNPLCRASHLCQPGTDPGEIPLGAVPRCAGALWIVPSGGPRPRGGAFQAGFVRGRRGRRRSGGGRSRIDGLETDWSGPVRARRTWWRRSALRSGSGAERPTVSSVRRRRWSSCRRRWSTRRRRWSTRRRRRSSCRRRMSWCLGVGAAGPCAVGLDVRPCVLDHAALGDLPMPGRTGPSWSLKGRSSSRRALTSDYGRNTGRLALPVTARKTKQL